MENTVSTYRKLMNRRRVITNVIIGVILLSGLFYFAKLPVSMVEWFVPFKVYTPYIPFEVEDSYYKISGIDRVKLVYENEDESMIVWATTEIGWNNVTQWDETLQIHGGKVYYNEVDGIQMISFRVDSVEYAIDYRGKDLLTKDELLKIASSIIFIKYAFNDYSALVLTD
ncbi:hypothetical protein [Bacillus suaedaesalsae]|uniref:DUF4367 domain-containing protein n=1 Tax=Bacillus suaedaesalsae TaxID=2810349 RepID=A0ABS2DHH9_9BACI|nr:hypothetical protein [Bacillus suaedaesalsae]MBM6617894.1 hypothetical protein [Bacillus suaedaesalsae]